MMYDDVKYIIDTFGSKKGRWLVVIGGDNWDLGINPDLALTETALMIRGEDKYFHTKRLTLIDLEYIQLIKFVGDEE